MIVDYAALADYASDRGGAIVACGLGINRLSVKQVPISHPQVFLVAQLRDEVGSPEIRRVKVGLFDPAGDCLSEINGSLHFSPTGEGDRVGRIVLGFYSVQFPRYGTYQFQVEIEPGCSLSLPFHVRPPG